MVDSNRRFTSDEVSAIVRRGLELQSGSGDISLEELEDIALQSGISVETLKQAIAEEETHREQERVKLKWRTRRTTAFYHHLRAYILVNVFLIAINLITAPSGYFWAVWPLLGWGLGLGFHAASTFFPNEQQLDRRLRRRARHKSRHRARKREHDDDASDRSDAAWTHAS